MKDGVKIHGGFLGGGSEDPAAKIAGAGIYVGPDGSASSGLVHEWRHCTIAFNSLSPGTGGGSGAGMHYGPGNPSDEQVTLDNSILYFNTGGSDLKVETQPSSVLFTFSCSDILNRFGGTQGTGVINVDPQSVNAAGGNFRFRGPTMLLPWSPCLDVGSDLLVGWDTMDIDNDSLGSTWPNQELLPLDFDLRHRIIDIPNIGVVNKIDMGAYETPDSDPIN